MKAWLESLRLPISILAGLLTVMSFKIAGIRLPPSVPLTVVCIACSTMLQNNWRDRFHDRKKHRVLASENPREFFALLSIFWIASFYCVAWISAKNYYAGIIFALMVCAGITYSEVRRMPFASTTLTALTSAAPALLPVAYGGNVRLLLLVFTSVAFIIFGRETLKDIDDQFIDTHYKWTITLAFGTQWAKIIGFLTISIGLLVMTTVSLQILWGLIISAFGLLLLVRGKESKTVRMYIDVGMAVSVLTVITFSG